MDKGFDAYEFVHRLRNGEFEGRVQEEIAKLSRAQLERVAFIMEEYLIVATGPGEKTDNGDQGSRPI